MILEMAGNISDFAHPKIRPEGAESRSMTNRTIQILNIRKMVIYRLEATAILHLT